MPNSWLSNIDFVLEYSSSLNIVGCENGMIMRNTALSSDSVYTTGVTWYKQLYQHIYAYYIISLSNIFMFQRLYC